jgi:hypothetical protein
MKPNRIRENEIPDILGDGLPGINSEMEKVAGGNNIRKLMLCFAQYTRLCAEKGNLHTLVTCFSIAETLLKKGNHTVKTAVENIYLFSVSSLLEIASPFHKQVQQLFPTDLKETCLKLKMNHTP